MDDNQILEDNRIYLAAQVLMLRFYNPKLTLEDACGEVGITVRQYRYWVRKNSDVIGETRRLIDEQQHETLTHISAAMGDILELIVKDALDPLTKPTDRVILKNTLREELNELQTTYHARPGIEEEAQAFLKKGPTMETKSSRFASIDVEKTDDGFRIGINEEHQVIDVSPGSPPVEESEESQADNKLFPPSKD